MPYRYMCTLASFTPASGKSVRSSAFVLEATDDGATWDTLAADTYLVGSISGTVIQRSNDDSSVIVDWSAYSAYQDLGNTAFRATYTVVNGGAETTYTQEAQTFANEDSELIPVGPDGYLAGEYLKRPEMPVSAWYYVNASDVVCTQQSFMDVTGLTFAIGANETWVFDAYLMTNQSGTGGMHIAVNGPASANVTILTFGTTSDASTFKSESLTSLDAGAVIYMTASGFDGQVHVHALYENGGVAGVVAVRVRRNTANGNARVYIGSYYTARRLA